MNVTDVQKAYRDTGRHVPSERRAQEIIDALPFMSMATGLSGADVLKTCIINHANGATDRLVRAHKDYLRKARVQ